LRKRWHNGEILEMTVAEIERAIIQLPPQDLAELTAWLDEYRATKWDQQIEEDLETGRLDVLVSEAEGEYRAGLAKPL